MVSQPWPRRQNSGPRTTSELAADLLLAAGLLRAGEWGIWALQSGLEIHAPCPCGTLACLSVPGSSVDAHRDVLLLAHLALPLGLDACGRLQRCCVLHLSVGQTTTDTLNTAEWVDISGGTRGPLMGCSGARVTYSRCNGERGAVSTGLCGFCIPLPRRNDVPSRPQPDGDRRYQAVLVTGAHRPR
jgi:hypothetical protein